VSDNELGDWFNSYGSTVRAQAVPQEDDQAGWLDVPKEVGATVAGTLAAPFGAAQVATATSNPALSNVFGGIGILGHAAEDTLRESESKVSRRAAEAKLFPGEGEESFMAHPIRSAIMQGAGLAGFGAVLAGVAAVAPEGLLASLISDAAAGGVLGAAGVADKVAQYYNDPELTDKKLAAQDPRFKQMVESGQVDPKEARNIVMQDMVHASPVIANGLAGAAGMGVGGRILRRATGGSGGVASRMALGGAENAVGMGGMGLAGTYADQDMEIAQGKRTDYDWRKMLMAAANNAAMGGVIGTGAGVLHKPDGRRVDRENVTNTAPIIEHTDDLAPAAADTAAIKGEPIPDPAANLAPYAAPGSKPLEPAQAEPTGAKSQGVASDERAALDAAQGREPVGTEPTAPAGTTPTPEVPVVHPGEPEAPVAAVVHPEAEKVAPDVTRVDTSEVGPRDSAVQTTRVEPVASEEAQASGSPRVLNDLTKPEVSVTNEDMARNLAQVKAEEQAAARREAGPQPGHATQKKLDQEAKNLEIATRVHASHPPMHPDDFKINNQANRDILKNRLQEQISDALASGVGVVTHEKGQPFENRIPGKVGAKPGPVMWLADAQRMLRKLNNKTAPKLKEIQEFLHSEYQGHQGEWGTLAVRRKTKGQEFGDAKKRAQELKSEDKPSIENLAAEGDAGEVRTHEQSPEDTLLSHETEAEASDEYVDTGKPSEAQIEKLKELDALAAEAKKSEEPAYTAGSNRTVPIERGRDRFAGMRPKVVKAIKLAEKIKKDANDIRLRKEPGDAALHGEILEAAKGSVTTTHSTEEPIRSSTLGEELKKLDAKNVAYGLKGFQKMMYPIFKNRLMAHAKDVTVHIVTREQMKRLTKEDAGGFWSEEHNHIVMVDKLADDPQKAALYLIHEGIHAAYVKVLEADPFLQDRIHRMMDVVHDYLNTNTHLIKDEKDVNELTYGLTDAHEFVAEAFSNRRFQELLSKIEIPQKLAKELGMEAQRKFSMWDVFVTAVRRALKMPKGTHSMLEGALRVAQELEGTRSAIMRDPVMRQELRMRKEFVENPEKMSLDSERSARDNILEFARGKADTAMGVMTDPAKALQDKVADAMYAGRGIRSTLGKAIRYVETNDQFRQRVEKFWPGFYEQNTVRRVFDTIQKQGVHAVSLMKDGHAISTRMARAYKRAPGAFSRFANLVHEATVYGFDPASDIGKGRNAYLELNQKVQAKIRKGVRLEDIIHDANAEHINTLLEVPRLREEYANLVGEHPEFGKLMDDTFKYFHDAQQEMTRGHIENILRAVSKGDQGAEHNIKRRADELLQAKKSDQHKADLAKEFGDEGVADAIYAAKSLSGREGPYAPLMRHGDWVVHGRYKFKAPTNAIQKVGPSSFEFASKKEAVDFARSSGLDARYDTAYYDPATGEKTTKAGGISTAGSAEQRWVAHLNDRHVEFHTSKKNALKAFDELNKTGHFESLNAPEVRKETHFIEGELSAPGMATIAHKLEQQDWYKNASSEERQSAKRALQEASISMMGGQRMQSRRLPRRNIAGYSDDLVGNFDIYNRSQANFRAKQEFRPQIDAALRDLQEHVEKGPYEKNTPEHTLRSEYLNEIQQRARAPDPNDYTGKWADFTRQLSTWSYIYRMGRISHLLLHQTHLPMITAPTIAGRHNLFRAYGATMHAWKELTGAYKKGGTDAFKALSDSLHEGTDYSKWIRETTRHLPDGERLHKLFSTLEELGWVHSQYEVEIQRHLQSQQAKGISGSLLRGMNHFDTVFRHATNATEMINRYAGSMAAYRLEFAKLTREGKSKAQAHDLAVEYARNTLANTQGVYSSTNAAPIFKQKILRPFLQFKQFPQMIYNLMAGNLIKAAKGGTTRERVEALSSFAYLVGAHTIMTGALGGVPLESAKIVATVGKGLNILPGDWSDVERWQYDKAVNLLGKDYADWFMHGLSRALGIDAHHRLGLNSFFTFGLPEGANSDSKSVWAWLGQQALGAPGGLGADALSAVSKIASGDVGGGFEKLAPQQIRDIYRAWNGGGKDYKYGAGETVARVLGFTPSGEAEHGERKAEARSGVESYNKEYRSLVRKWIETDNKADVWKRIQKWNEGKAKDSQITLKQLTDAAKRKKKAEDEGDTVEGIQVNKRTRFIAERANAIY
jgi:hypothetical protein